MDFACYPTFFEKMFESNLKECYQANIPIIGVDDKTINILVNYTYNGEITIDGDYVMDKLGGANYFQFDLVKCLF